MLFPRQPIPRGLKTGDLLSHNYLFWYELFNPRQLLCLDMLLRAILEINEKSIRELMLTLFSGCLEFNNMFCSYKGVTQPRSGAVRPIFSHHAFVMPREPLENNLWGPSGSSGTFPTLYYNRLLRAREYCLAPMERVIKEDRAVYKVTIAREHIVGRLANDSAELLGSDKNVLLLCQDSARLNLPDRSVDAIITDPPYFDNVQYSELADFFYVWLRLGLQGQYTAFEPELSPKAEEVVKNPRQGKDADFYQQGLTKVFRECHRVLKDDSVLVFTFHHKEPDAWRAMLRAVLNAGFVISTNYSVQAEMPRSLHIQNQDAMEYDAIIVCHKQSQAGVIRHEEIEEQIRQQATAIMAELTNNTMP